MTICRKCGREIPDGEELCEECKGQESISGESYLDDLIKSMGVTESDSQEVKPMKEQTAEEIPAEYEVPEESPFVVDDLSENEEPMPEEEIPELVLDEVMNQESGQEEEIPELVLDEVMSQEPGQEEELPDPALDEVMNLEPKEDTAPGDEPFAMTVEEDPVLDEILSMPDEEAIKAADDKVDSMLSEEELPLPEEELPLPEEELPLPEEELPLPEEELPLPEEELPLPEEELPLPEEELPLPEEEPVLAEEESFSAASDASDENAEINDINDLLDLLSKDYSEEDLDTEDEPVIPEDDISEETAVPDMAAPEVSLFSDDENDDIFADSTPQASASVEDIFQDALSAVDYSGSEEDESGAEDTSLDDLFALEGSFGPEEQSQQDAAEPSEVEAVTLASPVKKVKKDGFWKRVFGNIITEQTAEEEEKERELEKASAEERALAKEEKKKQAEADKEAKAAATQEEKEKKAALKAEQAAAKAAAKEEKKRQRAELEAAEVVGKINPVGATIVMVFFGLICVAAIFGTQVLSYSSAVKNAETQFEQRNYQAAYDSLSGVEVSDSSKEMADKIRICMQLQKELNSYSNYYEMKMYLEALDSLVKGIRSYDQNRDKADQYEILGQYNELEGKIASALFNEFSVSETEARNINASASQEEYTAKLEEIIARWEAKGAEDIR